MKHVKHQFKYIFKWKNNKRREYEYLNLLKTTLDHQIYFPTTTKKKKKNDKCANHFWFYTFFIF